MRELAECADDLADVKERILNFSPYVPPELAALVMAGFAESDAKAGQVAPESETPEAVAATEPRQTKRRSLWDVVTPYVVETMRAGQYANAKQLFNALEAKAGPESPFDKGVGPHRGSLFVRELSAPLALKTLQNRWQQMLSNAAKK